MDDFKCFNEAGCGLGTDCSECYQNHIEQLQKDKVELIAGFNIALDIIEKETKPHGYSNFRGRWRKTLNSIGEDDE